MSRSLYSLYTLFFFLFAFCSALDPLAIEQSSDHHLYNASTDFNSNFLNARQTSGDKPFLRIMPLGASITQGYTSSPLNGYRRKLREQLRFWGYEVDMIGCQSAGDFNDRQHEGHPSMKIADMIGFASCSIKQLPNVILLHAGTNDCTGAGDDATITKAGDDYQTLINWLLENSPGVTVITSTLIPNTNERANQYINVLNERIRGIASEMQQTQNVIMAEMGDDYIPLSNIIDGTHPTALGYAKMAAVWADRIDAAVEAGHITPPADNGSGTDDGDSQCASTPPSPDSFGPGVETQRGSGYDDGTYTHSSEPAVKLVDDFDFYKETGYTSQLKEIHFAQLVNINGLDKGQETDEMIRSGDYTNKDGVLVPGPIMFRLNDGGTFAPEWNFIDVKMDCLNRGHRWGDVNGDGLDDFICLSYPAGDMYVSLNRGGNPPTFENMGLIRSSYSWATQDRIRLGDIDGDGRLDWCAIDDVGDIYCWRNGGIDLPIASQGGYWQSMVVGSYTFKAQGMPGIEGVRLIDINGDQRADWVYVYPDGHTKIFINQRGSVADGPGLRPAWIEAAVAHRGFPGDDSVTRDNIQFARIYGTGRYDYIHHTETAGSQTVTHEMNVFKNTGQGGKRVKGDGARYCDMFGRGYDDYIWIWSGGEVELFENTQDLPNWKVHGQIYKLNMDRKAVHFGDWDGDGLCDILTVDKKSGVTHMYKNTWTAGKASPTFNDPIQVTGALCNQGWGVGLYDLGLRFADIDGDSRVDYLCMEKNGRTTGWLNTKDGLVDAKQIKFSENFDRASHRFADVNGDGKADFLWVDKFTGNVQVWLNGGRMETGGSTFFWAKQGDIWREGVDRGQNIHFPKLGLLGRADYHDVLPKTSQAFTYYNTCGGATTGGDDGDIVDPELPALPDAESELCKRDVASFIDQANCDLPSVDWIKTAETCDETQLRTIYDTHSKSIKIMEGTGDLEQAYKTSTPGFNRFFVNTPAWENEPLYKSQITKTQKVLSFAKGPPKKTSQRYKLTYYCKDPVWATAPRDSCAQSIGVGAKTYSKRSPNSRCEACAQINICSMFWDSPSVDNMVGDSGGLFLTDLAYSTEKQGSMNPKEQLLIHEWFHIWSTDTSEDAHPKDIVDTLRLRKDRIMYGAGLASRWAWYGFKDGPVNEGTLQTNTMINADNFGWMYVYNYLAKSWGWTDDGRWKYEWLYAQEQQAEKDAGYDNRYKRSSQVTKSGRDSHSRYSAMWARFGALL